MRHINLSKGYVVIVDDKDFEWLSKFTWSASESKKRKNGTRHVVAKTGRGKTRKCMHRLITKAKPGQIVDHRNRNPLDNSRSNLRIVTKRWMNNVNSQRTGESGSKYRGVSFRGSKWEAYIRKEGKQFSLGIYDTELDAAKAYNIAARFLHGDWAMYNELEVGPDC